MDKSLSALALLLSGSLALAADWPQFRGPARDGLSPETGLLRKWPKGGPKLAWKTNKAGLGLAGAAIVGGTVYTLGSRGEEEYALAFDSKDGKLLWETKLGPVYVEKSINAYSYGPNSTPTVAGGHVFALTSKGLLACLTTGGKLVWKKDLPVEMKGAVNNVGWGDGSAGFGSGYCWSPVAHGEHLLIAPGGSEGLLALLEARTGKLVWRSAEVKEEATYGSPAVGKVGGVEMALYVTQKGLCAVSMKDGKLIHRQGREDYPDVVCAMPHLLGDRVYFTVGYGAESMLLESDGKSFKEKWSSKELLCEQGGTVIVGKHIYGYHEKATWVCQELETGKKAWPAARVKGAKASVIAADGLLFAIGEDGKGSLIEASPKGFNLLGELTLPEKGDRKSNTKVWTHPSLSDGKLYLRDQEWLYCYQVK